jgi:predicted metal-dependent hydrolase
MKSDLNNIEYLVQNLEDKKEATDILSLVHKRIYMLKNYLEKNMDNYPEYKPYIKQFCLKINNLILMENSPDGKYTSYTVNKGDEIVLCLRSKRSKELHDLNLIMYVVLHELAHVACPEIDHTELFKKIFIFFIKIAVQLGIYENVNYQIDPHEYCGIIINENLLKN